ncbi:Rieske 2Fe-2S domain-containing protein [Nonomuraea sp. NPDC049695]|uniref:Rieske (2Fe-2S) protein n=1 Tax=Nonomuraea sp. NPDC049695 TaxID=3154734 RepID=UPI00344757DE
MIDWVRLAPAGALPPHESVTVEVDGDRIALFHTEHGFRALGGSCPHMGGPLSEGDVGDGAVTCPLHGWRYDLTTGERLDRRGQPVPTYPVEVRQGWLCLGLPAQDRS